MRGKADWWRRVARVAAPIAVAAFTLAACDSLHESKDFERHRYSQIVEPRGDADADAIYFDVRFDANYPQDNAVAEEIRMEWLAAWLKQRNMCGNGFEIESQRPLDWTDYNPGQYDMRYVVKCKVVAAG